MLDAKDIELLKAAVGEVVEEAVVRELCALGGVVQNGCRLVDTAV